MLMDHSIDAATGAKPTTGQQLAAAWPAENLRILNGAQRVICTTTLHKSHLLSHFETKGKPVVGFKLGTHLALTLRHGHEDANPHAVARRHPLRAEIRETRK